MTIEELITELQGFPEDLQVIGWNRGNFSLEPEVSKIKVNIDEHGDAEHFDELDEAHEAVDCLLIEFK